MRKTALALTAAAGVLAGGAIIIAPANAMTLGNPDGIRGALSTVDPVEQTGCWRYGWHGWGWYPFCGGPRWGYGWGPGWRWHHWHHWHHRHHW